ncbi:hypothetical protein NMG60_11018942 [Bertholletia excelsa]
MSAENRASEEFELRRGPWTLEEDTLLTRYVSCHGEGRWNMLAKCSGLKRTGKSCRLRWLNYLKPDIKRGNLSPQEQLLILELQSKWGNRWSRIAQHLPGRTDNEIKNYWRTRVQKQARQLKIDSNSKKFLEAVRSVWMPRLIEQMEQTSSPSLSPASTLPNLQEPSGVSFPQESQKLDCMIQPLEKPEVIFSDSSRTSELPVIPEHPKSPVHAFDHVPQNDYSLLNDWFYEDDMEGFQPIMNSQVVGSDCSGDDVAVALWNMDELWQLRTEEMGM